MKKHGEKPNLFIDRLILDNSPITEHNRTARVAERGSEMRFRYTRHARNRMRKDHLPREEIEGMVKGKDWGAQGGNRYRVYGDVRGQRVRVVFAHESDGNVTIISAFFDD